MSDNEQRLLMLIDGEPAQSRLIASLAAREGWRTLLIREPGSAVTMLSRHQDNDPGALCLDLSLAGAQGCLIVAELRSRQPAMPIIVIVDAAHLDLAIEALRAGATDYLVKPIATESLIQALRTAVRREGWGDETVLLSEKDAAPASFDTMVGTDGAFRRALTVAARAARGSGPILIEGEHGTGKETLARAIHAASGRASAPLRIITTGSNAPNAIESLLFGHEKDSFPGAFDERAGALQQCDGGTLMIDEVERLTPPMQARMLDYIRRGAVRPIGAQYSFRVDVRLITASDEPLHERASAGLFNPELLAAIGGTIVTLPALRERAGDLPDLAQTLLARIRERTGVNPAGIDEETIALLSGYDWPGNARQFTSALFRAAVFCQDDALTVRDFPTIGARTNGAQALASARSPSANGTGVILYTPDGNLRPLEDIEADIIRLAIHLYRGRMTEVARRLGIGRSTLYRKLGELGIDNAAA